jgi:hypothetical protein
VFLRWISRFWSMHLKPQHVLNAKISSTAEFMMMFISSMFCGSGFAWSLPKEYSPRLHNEPNIRVFGEEPEEALVINNI